MKRFFIILSAVLLLTTSSLQAQIHISAGTVVFIDAGVIVTAQGDVFSAEDILGTGKLLLAGTVNQLVDLTNHSLQNLEINNTAGATLTGSARITNNLLFTNGIITAGNYNLRLGNVATATGMGNSKFIATTGTGEVIKEITANQTAYEIPLGAGSLYRPAFLTTSGTYINASAGFKVLTTNSNKPPSISDYIITQWPVTRSGITGTVTVEGNYQDADISGTESFLRGYMYTTPDWSSTGEAHNAATNRVSAPLTTASGELTGMDKFTLIKTKAFLQGTYISAGIMADNLRSGTNLIPLADPYRTSPYNSSFTHSNNPITETASLFTFSNQLLTGNNIVDWIFLELRNNNASPGNGILETRSAFIQRDGDIVDVDGFSPVTFNRINDGNYTLAIRHRNHLGLSTDPATFSNLFTEKNSTTSLVDFSVATDAQLYGPSAAYAISADGRNMLWGGNANLNTNTRFSGLFNDRDYILISSLNNNAASSLNNVYHPADINLNRNVRYSGLSNDRDFLLISTLGNNPAASRSQALPN